MSKYLYIKILKHQTNYLNKEKGDSSYVREDSGNRCRAVKL